jgi:hypothetical protein
MMMFRPLLSSFARRMALLAVISAAVAATAAASPESRQPRHPGENPAASGSSSEAIAGFSEKRPAAISSIPETSTLGLMALTVLLITGRSRRSKQRL